MVLKSQAQFSSYILCYECVISEMQQLIQDHGVGNSEEPGALQQFYNQFMAPNRTS